MRLSNKGAIELSLNFLVTIIISIVLLGAGFFLLAKFVSTTDDTQKNLDQRTETQLSMLLDQGQQVAVPFSTQTLKRGEEHIFGIGVLNILDYADFKLVVDASSAEDSEGNVINENEYSITDWFSYVDSFSLDKNKRQIVQVLLTVPKNAKSGTYIFNVNVQSKVGNGNYIEYDHVKKIVINVP